MASRKALARYKAAVVAALGGATRNRSPDLVFATLSGKQDLDPEVEILVKRVIAIRRQICKSRECLDRVKKLLTRYIHHGVKGTFLSEEALTHLCPAPPVGDPLRHMWNPHNQATGPIALMLHSLHLIAAAMDTDLVVHQDGEADFSIMTMPYQHLRQTLYECEPHIGYL